MELPEQRLPENPSQGEIGRALAREAEAIRAKLPPGAALTAMCVEGPLRSSEELADMLDAWAGRGEKCLAFAIGGGICVAGQLVMDGYIGLGLEKTDAVIHVAYDIPAPPGAGDAAGAALPGIPDQRGREVP